MSKYQEMQEGPLNGSVSSLGKNESKLLGSWALNISLVEENQDIPDDYSFILIQVTAGLVISHPFGYCTDGDWLCVSRNWSWIDFLPSPKCQIVQL